MRSALFIQVNAQWQVRGLARAGSPVQHLDNHIPMQEQTLRTITVPNARLSMQCYAWQDSLSLSVIDSTTRDEVRIEGIKSEQAFTTIVSLVSGLKYHDEKSRARDERLLNDLEAQIKRVRDSWSKASKQTQSN